VRLKGAQLQSEKLKRRSVPHSLKEDSIKFFTFDDMSILLNMLDIHVDPPSTPIVAPPSRPRDQKEVNSRSFWSGVRAAETLNRNSSPNYSQSSSPVFHHRYNPFNSMLLETMRSGTDRVSKQIKIIQGVVDSHNSKSP
jgi:hypothetical protein